MCYLFINTVPYIVIVKLDHLCLDILLITIIPLLNLGHIGRVGFDTNIILSPTDDYQI